MMIATVIIFVEPDTVRRIVNKFVKAPAIPSKAKTHKWAVNLVLIFLAFQLLFPFRHFLFEGSPSWTEEGHNFAWHMKLRDKNTDNLIFSITNPETGKTWIANIDDYLTGRQKRKMSTRPHMVIQFAHHLRDDSKSKGIENPIINANIEISLNGRIPQPMIDPKANLAEEEYSLISHNDWIMPLPTGLTVGVYN